MNTRDATGLVRPHGGGALVSRLEEAGPWYVGGRVTTWERAVHDPRYHDLVMEPAQTRAIFAQKGWRDVVAFQTRNPLHRAHEYLTRCALELVDGLLLHPLVGPTREEDVPAWVRVETYEALMGGFYNPAHAMLALYPAAMRYAGPAEAVLHALVRRNYGCSHFVVGRDHAGVGDYYGTYDAQRIFARFDAEALGVQVLAFEHAFYCPELGELATSKTAPAGSTRVQLSGTRVRELLRAGQAPPPEVMRPEVAAILIKAMKS